MIRTIRQIALILTLLLGSTAGLARAADLAVYPGCEAPPAKPAGHAFFVDPLHGSRLGDGSRAHPWRTLEEVVEDRRFDSTPPARGFPSLLGVLGNGLVHGGDTVYLMSGNHGVVKIQGYFGRDIVGYANREFVTIAALPGEHPEITRLQIIGAARWVFRGLTFIGTNPTGTYASGGSPVKDYFLVSVLGPNTDIVFDHNTFMSQRDVSDWTLENWVTRRSSGLLDMNGRCIAVVGNTLRNIGVGLATQRSNSVLLAGNTIDYFADDGIDYGSSNLLIEDNLITNSLEDGDGFHRDAMQGQPAGIQAVVENVTIRNNRVIRIADKGLKYPGYLQGIDTFDGIWRNVTVTGNQIVTDAGHGIAFYGVHGLVVTHNIVLGDSGKLLNCVNVKLADCWSKTVEFAAETRPSINVSPSKLGDHSTQITISRNITTSIGVGLKNDDVNINHNVCVPVHGRCVLALPVAGALVWYGKPGIYGDDNFIIDDEPASIFKKYDLVELAYDLAIRKRLPVKFADQNSENHNVQK